MGTKEISKLIRTDPKALVPLLQHRDKKTIKEVIHMVQDRLSAIGHRKEEIAKERKIIHEKLMNLKAKDEQHLDKKKTLKLNKEKVGHLEDEIKEIAKGHKKIKAKLTHFNKTNDEHLDKKNTSASVEHHQQDEG